MSVNMNKTKVMWRTSEGEAEGCKMAMSAVNVLVAIHYSVLVARNKYIKM